MTAANARCLLAVSGRARSHGRPPTGGPRPTGGVRSGATEPADRAQWEAVARRLAHAFRVPVQTTRSMVRSAAVALAAASGVRPDVCDVEAYAARRLAADLAGRRRAGDR